MKNSHFLLVAAAAVVLSTVAFLPRPITESWPDSSAPVVKGDDTELTLLMKEINKSMRKLRSAIKDPERAKEACELVDGVQRRALVAKSMEPAMLMDIPAEEQGQFLIDYRKGIHTWLGRLFELEIALLETRTVDAKAVYKAMLKAKGPAHKKFQKPKD